MTVLHLKLLGAWGTPPVHAAALVTPVLMSVVCYRVVEVPWRRRLLGKHADDNTASPDAPPLRTART